MYILIVLRLNIFNYFSVFRGHGKIEKISMLAELFQKELPTFNSTGKDVTIEFANSIFLKV